MRYTVSIFKKHLLIYTLMTVVCLSGCVQEEFATPPKKTENSVEFSLSVFDVKMPSVASRSMVGVGEANKEDEVQSVDILVFDASVEPPVLLEWVEVESQNIEQNLAGGSSKVDFSAPLTLSSKKVCIAVVANCSLSGLTKGTPKNDVLNSLIFQNSGKWLADADNYTTIPMYGEIEVAKIEPSVSIANIEMKRMLARIDIQNSTSNFKIEDVYLANFNTNGYVSPEWDSNGKINLTPTAPNMPSDPGKTLGAENAIRYQVNGAASYIGEIYALEASAAIDAGGVGEDGNASRKNATCLIVMGKMIENGVAVGDSYYYRVDFTQKVTIEEGTKVEYMPLMRNYKYVVDINEVSGPGFTDKVDALASYTVMSNMKTRVISYNRNKIKDVVYNGQYMLGVSVTDVQISQFQISEYAVDVFTDVPGGWTATVTNGESWLRINDGTSGGSATMSGASNSDTQFKLSMGYFDNALGIGDTRTGTVLLKTVRLSQEITVTQKMIEPGVIKFVDAYGNEIENLFFRLRATNVAANTIEPQSVYVMFSTDRLDARLEPDRDFAGLIAYPDWGGLIPALNPDRVTTTPFYGSVQAFSVEPKVKVDGDGKSEYWRVDKLLFTLHNKEGILLGAQKEFTIVQALLDFSFQYNESLSPRSYEVHLGAEQYLQLLTNNNWEITKVEQLEVSGDDGTGLLITSDTDNDIVAGRSNADNIMWDQSVVDSDDDKMGYSVINRGYNFRLKLHPGKWKEGKSGTIRITFKNVMRAGNQTSYTDYPFYTTIDLKMVSEKKSYTDNGEPLFYLYPIRFDNRLYYDANNRNTSLGRQVTIDDAVDLCTEIGDGWRLPNANELLLSYVYRDALGGEATQGSAYAGQNIYGWYTNWTNNYWSSSSYLDLGDTNVRFTMNFSGGFVQTTAIWPNNTIYSRCVRNNSSASQKYPYIKSSATEAIIVSRETVGGKEVGVDPSVLFSAGETPGSSSQLNKIAPKLQVALQSGNSETGWDEANTACTGLGDGWRLPTHREMLLILAMGGSNIRFDNAGFSEESMPSWPSSFEKLTYVNWLLTNGGDDTSYWFLGPLSNKLDGWTGSKGTQWVHYRCVRSVN